MNTTIAPASLSNVEAIRKILSEATSYKLTNDDQSWGEVEWTADEVTNELFKEKSVYLVYVESLPVACFALTEKDDGKWGQGSNNALYLQKLAVSTGYHGKGIGKLIIDWVVSTARTEGLQYVRLDCDAKNEKLCAYYIANGFTLTNEVQLGGHATPTALFEHIV